MWCERPLWTPASRLRFLHEMSWLAVIGSFGSVMNSIGVSLRILSDVITMRGVQDTARKQEEKPSLSAIFRVFLCYVRKEALLYENREKTIKDTNCVWECSIFGTQSVEYGFFVGTKTYLCDILQNCALDKFIPSFDLELEIDFIFDLVKNGHF